MTNPVWCQLVFYYAINLVATFLHKYYFVQFKLFAERACQKLHKGKTKTKSQTITFINRGIPLTPHFPIQLAQCTFIFFLSCLRYLCI